MSLFSEVSILAEKVVPPPSVAREMIHFTVYSIHAAGLEYDGEPEATDGGCFSQKMSQFSSKWNWSDRPILFQALIPP
jgi:hypothetical protein